VLLTRRVRAFLITGTVVALTFVYLPLIVVVVNSFNPAQGFSWPPSSLSTVWWQKAASNEGVRSAFLTSVRAGLGATALALILGSMIAFAVGRYHFFGRNSVNVLFILPLALPGIITGVALNSAFSTVLPSLGISFGLFTVVLGHTTFCIVLVFNNVLARLRRMGTSLEEASMDLGADGLTTFWRVTLPALRSALVAGGLLAFALSFDEIVVTQFTSGPGVQTLPLWIFDNLFRPTQGPIVNVVAAALIVIFIVPVYLAQRLSDGSSGGRL
jgi:putative spermidine/putrescine transport system permease protein